MNLRSASSWEVPRPLVEDALEAGHVLVHKMLVAFEIDGQLSSFVQVIQQLSV